jgi:hypothetical protein
MRPNRHIAKRVVALGLAVWFGVLSVSIEVLHRHPATCGAPIRNGCSCDAAHSSDTGPQSSVAALRDAHCSGSQDSYPYCPACVFTKSCNQQAMMWTAWAPVFAPDAYLPAYDAGFTPFPIVLSGFPRAPPSPLT